MISKLVHLVCAFAAIVMTSARTLDGIPGFGRNLIIRSFPPVPDFQSNTYEVYMEPLLFDTSKPPLQALVVLGAGDAGPTGELIMRQWVPGGPVLIQGNVTGLEPGTHGMHITQRGDLREGCRDTGRHFNPYLHRHGGPRDPVRHLGDLGNIIADEEGVARIRVVDPLISLSGPRNIVGRALVITTGEDDLGRAGTEDSALNGSSGNPVTCGIIAYLS